MILCLGLKVLVNGNLISVTDRHIISYLNLSVTDWLFMLRKVACIMFRCSVYGENSTFDPSPHKTVYVKLHINKSNH